MKLKKIGSLILVFCFLASLMLGQIAVAQTSSGIAKLSILAYDGTKVNSTLIDPETLNVGDVFGVKVKMSDAIAVQGADIILEYNPAVLEVVQYEDEETGETKNRISAGVINGVKADPGTLDSINGIITYGAANQSAADYNDAVLLTVGFKLKAEGPAYVKFKRDYQGKTYPQFTTSGAQLIDLTNTTKEDLSFGEQQATLTSLALSGSIPSPFNVGDTFDLSNLTLTGFDQNSQPYSLAGKQVTWQSDNPAVASANGSVLTAVTDGSASITAIIDEVISNSIAVNVINPVSGPAIAKLSILAYDGTKVNSTLIDPETLNVGDAFGVKVKMSEATAVQGADIILEYNPAVLEVVQYEDEETGETKNRISAGVINGVKADPGTLDSINGIITYGAANQSAADYNDAVLLTVGFKLKAEGTAYVKFKRDYQGKTYPQFTTSGAQLIDLTNTTIEDLSFGEQQATLTSLALSGSAPSPFNVGDTFDLSNLTLTGFDQNSQPYSLAGKQVTWQSDNTNVALINGSVLTAVYEGTAYVTAEVEGVVSNSLAFRFVNPNPDLTIGVTILNGDFVSWLRPATIKGNADKSVNWHICVYDPSGRKMGENTFSGASFSWDWAPSFQIPLSDTAFTVEVIARDEDNNTAKADKTINIYNYPMMFTSVKSTDFQGKDKTSFNAGDACAFKATLKNLDSQSQDVLNIIQVKKGNVVMYLGFTEGKVNGGEEIKMGTGLTLPSNFESGEYTIESYAWNKWPLEAGWKTLSSMKNGSFIIN